MALVISKGVSSSSSTHQPKNFDVFLSFRDQDTCHGFISHLYEALCLRGIHTFIDDKLLRGGKIPIELLKTIENSLMSIIVFLKTMHPLLGVWMSLPRLLSVRRKTNWCDQFFTSWTHQNYVSKMESLGKL